MNDPDDFFVPYVCERDKLGKLYSRRSFVQGDRKHQRTKTYKKLKQSQPLSTKGSLRELTKDLPNCVVPKQMAPKQDVHITFDERALPTPVSGSNSPISSSLRRTVGSNRNRKKLKPIVIKKMIPHIPSDLKEVYQTFRDSNRSSLLKYINADTKVRFVNKFKAMDSQKLKMKYPKLRHFIPYKRSGQRILNISADFTQPKVKEFRFEMKTPQHEIGFKDGNHSLDSNEHDSALRHKSFINSKFSNVPIFDLQTERPNFVKQFGKSYSSHRQTKKNKINLDKLRSFAESVAKSNSDVIQEIKRHKIAFVHKKILDDGIGHFRKDVKVLHNKAKPVMYGVKEDVLAEYTKMFSL
ncbi:unnamed protein product [Moneuplotes crassus]|uniref:Uncharacterized protein n=1 Tax=Euplotes crassus TaxID=5936 RepID=A0AAD1XFF4_EUPCR|nr:unnamed protein product [Moneuplotes crassus]